jgi:hypothetical protein
MSTAVTVIQAVAAVGTLAVAVMAIWGERVRSWLTPPKLVIQPYTLRGDPTFLTYDTAGGTGVGQRAMYYHLKVVNIRPWLTVHNCRVLLKALSRRGPDGQFHPVPMAVPLQFIWAPSEDTPSEITITNEHVLDFGRLVEGGDRFAPMLRWYANNFEGLVRKNEAVRYYLEINASNFVSRRYYVFEVACDGEWHFEPEKMQQHLRIREIVEP